MFRVGQKVVCIDFDDDGGESCDCHPVGQPDVGDVATVMAISHDDEGVALLHLKEFPSFECEHCCAGWSSLEWRPAVERKTDISVFTAMLTPTRKTARIPARAS